MQAEIDTELAALFARMIDAAPDDACWTRFTAALNRRRYISNLVRDVDKELNVHLSN